MASRKPKTLNVFKATVFNTAIDAALERSCHKVIKREPCYTAALTEELPRILNDIINKNAKETGTHSKYRFGSCYVHQTPYVKFGPNFGLRRELGYPAPPWAHLSPAQQATAITRPQAIRR